MVAPEITDDIGDLLNALRSRGYLPVASEYSAHCFGNYVVELSGPLQLRIIRERGQYLLYGNPGRLEGLGLSRALERSELRQAVGNYVAEAV